MDFFTWMRTQARKCASGRWPGLAASVKQPCPPRACGGATVLDGLRYDTPLGEWLERHPATATVLPEGVLHQACDKKFSLGDAAVMAGWPREELMRLLVQSAMARPSCGGDCASCSKGNG